MHSFYTRQICPLKGFVVSAHMLSPSPPIPLLETPHLKSNLPEYIYIYMYIFPHTTTFQLLDKPWSQVSSLLPPGSCLNFSSRIGISDPTARRFDIKCGELTRSRAFRKSICAQEKVPTILYEYELGGARTHETELYHRLEDNLIRHRCDRIIINTTRQLISPHYLSSHPCRSFNSFPPPPPPLFSSHSPLVQTPRLKLKSARVINTTTQLI